MKVLNAIDVITNITENEHLLYELKKLEEVYKNPPRTSLTKEKVFKSFFYNIVLAVKIFANKAVTTIGKEFSQAILYFLFGVKKRYKVYKNITPDKTTWIQFQDDVVTDSFLYFK